MTTLANRGWNPCETTKNVFFFFSGGQLLIYQRVRLNLRSQMVNNDDSHDGMIVEGDLMVI
jgi:hypothetical protein